MPRFQLAITALLISTTLVLTAHGAEETKQPADSQYRTWTDPVGGHTIDAKFVDVDASTATLQKKGTGEQIRVPLDRLSKADIRHIASIRRSQRRVKLAKSELSSLDTFYEQIEPTLSSYAEPASEGETAGLLRKRKERLIQSFDDQIRGETFSFVAEVVDSRLSMHTPTESGAASSRDFDTFNLTLRHQQRPVLLPATLQARIGDLGRVLEPKDQVVLRCGVGNLDDKIGEFTLGYANSVITTDCSILAVEKLKAALPPSLFVEAKKTDAQPHVIDDVGKLPSALDDREGCAKRE